MQLIQMIGYKALVLCILVYGLFLLVASIKCLISERLGVKPSTFSTIVFSVSIIAIIGLIVWYFPVCIYLLCEWSV